MSGFRPLIEGLSFTEAPRWREGRLWFADVFAGRVLAVSLDGSVEIVATVAQQPGGLGWLPDRRLLMVSMLDRRILRLEDNGAVVEHADLSALAPWELNDMVVDAFGRAYVGQYGFDYTGGARPEPTKMFRVDPDGVAHVLPHELCFPNGMVISADGSTLIVAESAGHRLSAFAIEPDGSLSARRAWATFPASSKTAVAPPTASRAVVPDGICLDAEGAAWVADAAHGRLLRVAQGGEILDELATPTAVFACMLGGEDGRTLFACTSELRTQADGRRDGAAILMTEVAVPHAGLP